MIVVSHRRLNASLVTPRARTPLEAGRWCSRGAWRGRSASSCSTRSAAGLRAAHRRGTAAGRHLGSGAGRLGRQRARSLEALVGHLDALALHGLLSTDRPAGLIGRSWPVAYIDGWEADPLSIARQRARRGSEDG